WLDPVREEDGSLAGALQTQKQKAALADFFYVPSWKSSGELGTDLGSQRPRGGRWLIFADAAGIGGALAGAVGALGIEPIVVRRGEEFRALPEGGFCVRATQRKDYEGLLKALKRGNRVPQRIVHLWSAERTPPSSAGVVQEQLEVGFYSLFHLAQ